jgi:hypothetical protein
MKWEGACILLFDPSDWVTKESANAWKKRYKVPDNRCFVLGQAIEGYTITTNNCLKVPISNFLLI